MTCTARCQESKAKRCRCSCGGRSHGSAYRALQELDATLETVSKVLQSFGRVFAFDPVPGVETASCPAERRRRQP